MKTPDKRIYSMAELKGVKTAIEARVRLAAAEVARQQLQQRRSESARELFVRAAGAVQVLPPNGRFVATRSGPAPVPRQFLRDEQAALVEAISDAFDVSTLLEVDDQMAFRQYGIGADVTRKLRMGHWSIQRQLDLHGLRTDEARAALVGFIRESCQQGLRCIRVIHGKGLGSPGRTPVLKNKVHAWLVQKKEVLAFVQARPADGGAGAVVVLLAPPLATRRPAAG